jgi:hypothetical protein
VKEAGVLGIQAIFLFLLLWSGPTWADGGPQAPCSLEAVPAFPALGMAPAVQSWAPSDLPAGWVPPACAGWGERKPALLTALSGRFQHDGTVDDLLARFAAVSAWRGIRYWSVTDHRWEILITDAAALAGQDPSRRRADFTSADMQVDADLYFLNRDNRSSAPVVYRMRVEQRTPTQVVLTIGNVGTVWWFVLPIFAPGDLLATYVLKQLSPGVWGYYSLSDVREGVFGGSHAASYENRAVAIYRHVVGVPTDQEPPARR